MANIFRKNKEKRAKPRLFISFAAHYNILNLKQ